MNGTAKTNYRVCFVDISYGRGGEKFRSLKESYDMKGYRTMLTNNVEEIFSIVGEKDEKIVLFWHLSSSKWKNKIIAPNDIVSIISQITTDFHKKYGVSDNHQYKIAAENTRWFNGVYGWYEFYEVFFKKK